MANPAPPSHVLLPSRIPDDFVQSSAQQHQLNADFSWSGGTMNFLDNATAFANNFSLDAMPPSSTSYMSAVEAVIATFLMIVVALTACLGNILVVVSVFTYPPLKTCQNYLIASLAVADVLLSVLVMPFQMVYAVAGVWRFGLAFCIFSLTMDVCLCTASILNLVAIALDRYWAIHDPINYSQKRTAKRVLAMIAIIWIMSFIISSPPLFGWNDWGGMRASVCEYTQELGYIVYSSFGSFFIPLIMLLTIYFRIFLATRRRLRKRAQANKSIMQRADGGRRGEAARQQHISQVVVNSNNVTKLDSSEDNPDEDSPSCVGGETGNDGETATSGGTANNNETTLMSTLSRQGSLLKIRQQQLQTQQTSLLLPSNAQQQQKLPTMTDNAKLRTTTRTDTLMTLSNNNNNCDVAGVEDDEESVALPKNVNIKQSTRDLLKKSCAEIVSNRPTTPPTPKANQLHQLTATQKPNTVDLLQHLNSYPQQQQQQQQRGPNESLHINETSSMLVSSSATTSSSNAAEPSTANNSLKSTTTMSKNDNKPHVLLPTAATHPATTNAKNGTALSAMKASALNMLMTPPTPRVTKKGAAGGGSLTFAQLPYEPETPPINITNNRMAMTATAGSGANTTTTNSNNNNSSNFVANAWKERQKISLTKERKAARTLLMIVAGFTACWLPFFLAYVIVPFCPQCGEPPPRLWMFVLWLGYCNSAINPFIYTTSVDFRRGFARVLSRYFGKICPCFKKLDDGSRR